MKTYIVLLLLSLCNLGHTAGSLKETKGDRVAVQTAAQPLARAVEMLQFVVARRLPSAFEPNVRRVCIEFCGADALNLSLVCKDWANTMLRYANSAKEARDHLASVGLKLLPGKNFCALYFNEDSQLEGGQFTSTALRVFVTKRYREISKGIEIPETQFSDVPGNFAQRLVTASRTLDAIPAMSSEMELLNKVHTQLGALASPAFGTDFEFYSGIELDKHALTKSLYDLLQNTQLPSVLPGKLTEPQTVCYELLKALKSYLVLKRESSLSRCDYYRPDEQLIFNFLKGPDFPSNLMATKEEVSAQIKGALTLTKALIEKRKAELVAMQISVRNALLA